MKCWRMLVLTLALATLYLCGYRFDSFLLSLCFGLTFVVCFSADALEMPTKDKVK